jgi:hypothetical protein
VSLRVCKGVFTAATVTGVQTVTGMSDGTDFTPEVVLLWTTYQTAAGYTDEAVWQMGASDGTSHWSVYCRTSDNNSPSDGDSTSSTASWVVIRNLTGTNQRVGAFSAFNPGEFAIDWTTADAVAAIFHFVALAGTDISGQTLNFPSTTFVPSVTPAFPITALLLTEGAGAVDSCFTNVGWAASDPAGTVAQGAMAITIEDQATSDTHRYQRTTLCSTFLSASTGAVAVEIAYSHLGLNLVTSASTTVNGLLLGGSGLAAAAGSFNAPTSTGAQSVTGLTFEPKVIFVMSYGETAQATLQTQARWSFGAATASAQGRSWFGGEDNVATSQTARGHSTSVVVSTADPNATGASSVATSEAALTSLNADGFTLNWTAADATARQILWLALGDADAAATGGEHSHVFVG